MNLKNYAKTELEKAGLFDQDSVYNGKIGDAVYKLIELFSSQGHSNMSGQITLSIFNKVVNWEPLSPITGEKDEWMETDFSILQNKRLLSLFEKTVGKPYYTQAIVWREKVGDEIHEFTGTVEDVSSHGYVKQFPFTPKTFYIDVEKKNDVYKIKDKKQLKEVWKYYNKYVQEE